MRQSWAVTALLLIAKLAATAQPLSFNFRRVTVADGMNMSATTAICEDKYGYIWLGTGGGLNRFDGYKAKVYEHRYRDSTSLMPSAVRYLYCDSQGRLWVSFMDGLMEYDYTRDCFKNYNLRGATWVTNVLETQPGTLFVATSHGLVKLNTATGDVVMFDSLNTAGRGWPAQVREITRHGNDLYLATINGLAIFNLTTETWRPIPVPDEMKGQAIDRIAINDKGDVWMASRADGDPIWRTTIRFDHWKKYTELTHSATGQLNFLNDLYYDRQGRLWVSTALNGIALYDPAADKLRMARIEPWMPNGMLGPFMGRLYEDRKGQIWAESYKGACYFDPDENFFQTILPGNRADAADGLYYTSGVAERPDGQLWIGTGEGLVLFNPVTGQYHRYWNEPEKPPVLHNNTVRSLWLDRRGDLWICTNKGVNLLRSGRSSIESASPEGLPEVITISALESSDGTIWIANYSDGGHYYRPAGEKKFRSFQDHPVLKPYADRFGHCMLEDSRGWLWFGLDGLGLIRYDPKAQRAQLWERTPQNDTTLIGGYVFGLCEAPDGTIWAATTMGLSAIDPNTFRFTNYDRARGLPSNRTASVLADKRNRIWIGTPQGLWLLDSTRQHIRQFDMNDGLPEMDFVALPASRLADGRFAFPTRRGLVTFYPEAYVARQPGEMSPLLSGIRVFNQAFGTPTNCENLKELYLPPGKNFFSLDITALNFANPRQTWYAYKMEPYDRAWTYTRERTANYTNVPGGNYTFRFKASTDPNNWAVPERTLRIRVGEYWYRSRWFWGAVALVVTALGYGIFRRRAELRKAFLNLERKAQALAKEKALVQYENLTQQLNPHFLFNSLASLGSLIRFDPKAASEFLEGLSKTYRYILQSRDRETVALHEEVAFAEYFLKLQKTRFGEALQVRFTLDPQLRERKIVPVILQNLLENAMKHNTLDNDDPLVVEIFTEKDYLVVRNNLQRRPVVETSNKQGLSRLQSLYQYLSDAPMLIEETEYFFTVKIPLLERE